MQTHRPSASAHGTDPLEEMKILGFHSRPTETEALGLGCRDLEFNEPGELDSEGKTHSEDSFGQCGQQVSRECQWQLVTETME